MEGLAMGRGAFAVAVENESCRLLLPPNLCGGVRECVGRRKRRWQEKSIRDQLQLAR
jgi:hypothetical protein